MEHINCYTVSDRNLSPSYNSRIIPVNIHILGVNVFCVCVEKKEYSNISIYGT